MLARRWGVSDLSRICGWADITKRDASGWWGITGSSYRMMVLHHSSDLPNDLDLDLHLDLNLNLDLDFWHIDHWPYDIHLYDYVISMILHHSHDLDLDLNLDLNRDLDLEHHHPTPSPTNTIYSNTQHYTTPHTTYHINVILNVNRRMKLRVIFIKRLHCPESAVIWRKTWSNNCALLHDILYIQV